MAVIFILCICQFFANSILDRSLPFPEAHVLGPVVAPCGGAVECVALTYGPAGVPWVEDVMRKLAEENGLRIGIEELPKRADEREIPW